MANLPADVPVPEDGERFLNVWSQDLEARLGSGKLPNRRTPASSPSPSLSSAPAPATPSLPAKPTGRETGGKPSYAAAAKKAAAKSQEPARAQAKGKSPALVPPPKKRDERVFVSLAQESPFRKMQGPSLMAHTIKSVPVAKGCLLSALPSRSGVAFTPLPGKTSALDALKAQLGSAFLSSPARQRDEWTKVVVHKVPARLTDYDNGNLVTRDITEGEILSQMSLAFGVAPTRCTWSANRTHPDFRAVLVSFAQGALDRPPSAVTINGCKLVVGLRQPGLRKPKEAVEKRL